MNKNITADGISIFHPAFLVATALGFGKIPFAPGTIGSILAVIDFYIFHQIFSVDLIYVSLVILLTFVIGIYATDIYIKKTGKQDPKEVIIDEVIGQYITLIMIFAFLEYYALNAPSIGFELIIFLSSFALFRFFDIAKPSLVGIADKKVKGAFGVILDDIIAGIFAGIILIAGVGFYFKMTSF